MIIQILESINNFNEFIFSPIDNLIEKLPFEPWAIDAIVDSVHLIPFLFIIFLIIELIEFYFSKKIDERVKKANKSGVLVGALASILPQCGFSVIASSLYSRKIITRGCLLAVYLGTSDETIPILLAHPSKSHLIIPIVGLKLTIAIIIGYLIDFITGSFNKKKNGKIVENGIGKEEHCHCHCHDNEELILEEGCCNHNPTSNNIKEIFIHPMFHTLNIFSFILVITFILNYALSNISVTNFIQANSQSVLQPVITALIGLVPNCAISIAITMMLIKGTITFGSAMSGLLSNAGLGLLVLFKNNNFKDSMKIIILLLIISILTGIIINNFYPVIHVM